MMTTPEETTSNYETKHFPLFSIITITLNNYHGLIIAHNSLKNQSFKDYEWLVIDGGSQDETIEFLHAYRSKTRNSLNQFHFISQKDDGIYGAMNSGINMAQGHYLLFLNAGDALSDDKILEHLAPLCEDEPDFIYGDALEKYQNLANPILKEAICHKYFQWGMFTHHQAMIYRRQIIRDLRLRYSLQYSIAGDYDFTARFLKKAKKIKYINKSICVFEMGGISQQNAWSGRREQYIIREEQKVCPLLKNLWILVVQTLSWNLKKISPWLYNILKPTRKVLAID